MSEAPDNQADSGRDEHGRFRPGVSGNPNGRPRRVDFQTVVESHVKSKGMTVEQAIAKVFDSLEAAGQVPDATGVAANRILLDRLCGPVEAKIEHSGSIDLGLADRVRRARERAARPR